MMPSCDADGCRQIASRMYPTADTIVALCKKHDPASSRSIRRAKAPSNPSFTKRRASKRRSRA